MTRDTALPHHRRWRSRAVTGAAHALPIIPPERPAYGLRHNERFRTRAVNAPGALIQEPRP